jgi:AraC family transcriptional regulator
MGHLHVQPLFEGPLACVADVACTAPRSAAGSTERSVGGELVFPRRGVFVVHRHGGPAVADAATALVLRAGDEYRVSHPADGGDRCTAIAFAPDVFEEALCGGGGWPGTGHVVLRPATQLRATLLIARLARGVSPLAAEEAALLLLDAVADDAGHGAPPAATNQRVEQVRALLAADPPAAWRLRDVAAAVHCSPFHLARQFRAATGETIARYVTRLRLALALERVAAGEEDLARLAHDVGFAHHSHFSARFRALFAATPSEVRTIVTAPRADDP